MPFDIFVDGKSNACETIYFNSRKGEAGEAVIILAASNVEGIALLLFMVNNVMCLILCW